jgi:hypothetical protein
MYSVHDFFRRLGLSNPFTAGSDDLGSAVTAERGRRAKIIDGACATARAWRLLGLPYDQFELVALGVGERGLADRRDARRERLGRERDRVERPGAQGGQPLDLLVVVVGDQDGVNRPFYGSSSCSSISSS